MAEPVAKPSAARILRTLKAFQRDTVDLVFDRMYKSSPPARRFLVADEVGLGKTLVARGVIAKAIEHLWDRGVRRIDVVYICSNSGIARQNIKRLNVTGHIDHQLPDRITLLPRDVKNLRHKKINFISFTPGTSFNLRSSMGVVDERALLYWLLPNDWHDVGTDGGAISLLCGTADRSKFKSRIDEFRRWYGIDEELQEAFRKTIGSADELRGRFQALTEELGRRSAFSEEENRRRAAVIGELRQILARVCIRALEPDLIILDEFQRFKNLLHGDDFGSELARALFEYESSDGSEHARVLLLSATPYKMYTLDDEASNGEQHLNDFLDTARFLFGDEERTRQFTDTLNAYSRELWRSRSGTPTELRALRDGMQRLLRQVMVRTERLAVTPDRNGMLTEVTPRSMSLAPGDLPAYVAMQRVAAAVQQGDTLEYWKSAPYLLNFMDDYQLKEHFRKAVEAGRSDINALAGILAATVLTRVDVDAYARIDSANARLRWLLSETTERNAAEQFWLPPARAQYVLESPFRDSGMSTKFLVFSAWQVVPKVVSSFLSYEAERRLLGIPEAGQPDSNTAVARRRRRGRLRFTRSQGRLTGMPVLALVYPSTVLTRLCDPLSAAKEIIPENDGLPSLDRVLSWAESKIREALDPIALAATAVSGGGDQRWYWAAPLLLDARHDPDNTREWFGQANLSRLWELAAAAQTEPNVDGDADPDQVDRWSDHIDEARQLLNNQHQPELGAPPENLAHVLALLGVGGFANSALRAIARVTGPQAAKRTLVRNAAGQIAHGLRSLFNQPEVTAHVQASEDDGSYWRRALEYAAKGGLSAVVEEYAHVALEADSLAGKSDDEVAAGLAARMTAALTLQTATLRADHIAVDAHARTVRLEEPLGFRTAFAVRYGARGDEGAAADRNQRLQTAFNSPFWPFVLCSTSVGQEGLDFHPYCHAVVHWNLPSNPVDLEQREGRVHRYKGHAVRKNVALRHRGAALGAADGGDPWALMFREARSAADSDDDLIPYWIYTAEGGAQIERHVPALPLSRDVARKHALQRALVVYRMAFGQSRQEDLVAFLASNVGDEERRRLAADVMIDLSPPRSKYRGDSGVDPTVEPAAAITAVIDPRAAGAAATTSLYRLKSLLDAFAAMPQSRGTPRESRLSVDRLADLLDQFGHLRAKSGAATQVGPLPPMPEQFAALLDAYVAIRPAPIARPAMLPRFQALLDAYTEIRHKSQGV